MLDCAGNLVPVVFPTQGGCRPTGLSVLNNDIAFGTKLEMPVINILEQHFNETINRAEDKFSPFDAYSENTKYEIKSRRNRYNQYPTTIIACDKTRTKGRLVFVFHFTDGLYYIEYNEEKFRKFEIKPVSAIRAGGVRTLKDHFFIPIECLEKINI
jgi:hypothetical protein